MTAATPEPRAPHALVAAQRHGRYCPLCARGDHCSTGIGLTRRWLALEESAARGVRVPLLDETGGVVPEGGHPPAPQ